MEEKFLTKSRLDIYLTQTGKCSSRSLAKKLILDSCVSVNGVTENKVCTLVSDSDVIEIKESKLTQYVGRGAFKLEEALRVFDVDVKDMICLDIGASTGGFTDVLLQNGAARVYAVENGRAQLHEKLRQDNRVISLENTDARKLTFSLVPICDLIVMDVSFISQTFLYSIVDKFLKPGGFFISLIKPQFEAGREYVGKNGIVKDNKIHREVIDRVILKAAQFNLKFIDLCVSPIEGGDGNTEFLAYFVHK